MEMEMIREKNQIWSMGGGMITKDDDVAFSPCWNTVCLFDSEGAHGRYSFHAMLFAYRFKYSSLLFMSNVPLEVRPLYSSSYEVSQ